MHKVLIIVPCGQSKVWHRYPYRGPTPAADVYTSNLFKLNRAYAAKFGTDWLILSAKYGFIRPNFMIPRSYDVTFNRPSTGPISQIRLRAQVMEQSLNIFDLVVVLGGAAYRDAAENAFEELSVPLIFPFAGLPLGKMMQATKNALMSDSPGFEWETGRYGT